jgi:hypothetical protein
MQFRRLTKPAWLLPLAFLAYFVGFAYQCMGQALFRTWFFSSDEYVLAAEIIRFSNLDFRQHFFDNPGTFFMLLDTPIWATYYAVQRALGAVPQAGLDVFTFQHLPALFVLMRATTLTCFLLSAVLLFVLGAKILNPVAGALASLLLLMSPAYTAYSSFTRTESLAMTLMLAATLWLMRDIERHPLSSANQPRLGDPVVVTGILVGLAAGARLHSLTAALPLLVLILWMERPFAKPSYPPWVLTLAKWVLPLSWVAAGLVGYLSSVRLSQKPGAQHFLIALALAWGAGSVMGLAFYCWDRTRPMMVRMVSPDVIKLTLGCCIGGVLGNPTVFWQHHYFLGSVQMYSGYVDQERLSWPFWKNVTWYVSHYVSVVAPDTISLALLFAGVIWIVALRDRRLVPFLAGAALFFLSKPLALRAFFHHIILWLPFFYLVCAYPVGKLMDLIASRGRHGAWWANVAGAIVLYGCFHAFPSGPKMAVEDMRATEERLHSVERATAWIKSNTEPDATLAISYFCFNPDAFYAWLRSLEVPVPASVLGGRDYTIWWGHERALRGKAGYACVTPSDLPAIKKGLDMTEPGQGTDPYTDARFRRVASFGAGASEVDLFRYDYR